MKTLCIYGMDSIGVDGALEAVNCQSFCCEECRQSAIDDKQYMEETFCGAETVLGEGDTTADESMCYCGKLLGA